MKKYSIYALTLAVTLISVSCDTIWENTKVPEAVKVQFADRYPTIKQADWDHEEGNFEAEFKVSGLERTALFTPGGKLISYTEEIDHRHLPKFILEQVQAKYANYKIDEAHRIQQNGAANYVVELEDKMDEVKLRFDASGKLIEQQAAANVQHQEASLLPTQLPGKAAAELGEPVARWELPAKLREVSGIAMLPDGLIACVQDEEGAIHLYDTTKKRVVQKIDFAGPGDYEGIVMVDKNAFILRSDGSIFEVQDFRDEKPTVNHHKTVLANTQNTEGLAFDKKNERLLIACKGFDTRLGDNKGIYTFSLATKEMQPEPVFNISLAQADLSVTTKKKKKSNKYDVLQPSSFEVHPLTGDLYLLDAVNSRLHIINEQGQVLKTTQLDKNLLKKPEGMTFGTNGELYIASEGGKKGAGVIVKYAQGI
ncbi:SdiA-regulated domain-containing protein [Pontibacter sp. H259]|uniref:SdiA-regulated domain-containing protein n=1 Tax=Pontibacter sp. H259 TaxID=3133421 RepID=UPI0030C4FC3F